MLRGWSMGPCLPRGTGKGIALSGKEPRHGEFFLLVWIGHSNLATHHIRRCAVQKTSPISNFKA